jgi:heat shock protein HslJ
MRSLPILLLSVAVALGAAPGSPLPAAAQTDPSVQVPTPAAQAVIPPVVWNLIDFPGVGPINEPGRYTVQFLPDGQVSARADCNWVGGFWSAANGALDITITQTTLVGCPPDSLEQPFVVNLDEATSYTLDGFLLTISSPNGTMSFSPEMPAMA